MATTKRSRGAAHAAAVRAGIARKKAQQSPGGEPALMNRLGAVLLAVDGLEPADVRKVLGAVLELLP